VDPTGNDASPGTQALPFASLDAARKAVRTVAASMTNDIIVNIAPGDYYVTQPVSFDEGDSGLNGHHIVYQTTGLPGSSRFIGGQVITNWTTYQGSILRASVEPNFYFHTLYENGQRARLARYPNFQFDPVFPTARGPYLISGATTNGRWELPYQPGDLTPQQWNLTNAQMVVWSGGWWIWFTDIVPIASVDVTNHILVPEYEFRYTTYQEQPPFGTGGSRYFLQGSLDFLDEAGEFYLDPAGGFLYYWPMTTNVAAATIVAPQTQVILNIQGSSPSNPVQNIVFEGLRFEETDFTDWYRFGYANPGDAPGTHKYPSIDHEIEMPQNQIGTIFLENTTGVAIRDCWIKNSGFSGIFMQSCNQNDTVYGNWIEHSGHSGIKTQGNYPAEGDVLRTNLFSNNLIHDMGELVGNGGGIMLTYSSSNEVSYSEIFRGPRFGVIYSADAAVPAGSPDNNCHDNVFNYLNIREVVQDSGDSAGLDAYGVANQRSSGNQILISQILLNPSVFDYAPWGFVMDNICANQVFQNVQVLGTDGNLFNINNGGPEYFTNMCWQTNFNNSLMDYANIGLKSDFQYFPPTLHIATPSTASNSIVLQWAAQPGRSYLLQQSSNMLNWANSGVVLARSTNVVVTNSTPATPGPPFFYRLGIAL
jgi:hypothetical protein